MSRQWTKKFNINKYTSLYADSRGNRDLMKLRQWQQRKKKNNRFNEQNKHPKSTGMLKNLTSTSWSVCNKEETKVHSLTPIFCL